MATLRYCSSLIAVLVWLLSFAVTRCNAAPRSSFRELRFSPDGQYVLAQDNFEITVLTVKPLLVSFRIPAANVAIATFTPDSQEIAFVRRPLRSPSANGSLVKTPSYVERWNLKGGRLSTSSRLPTFDCGTEELSPDGEHVVCVDYSGTLRILDVASGDVEFQRKGFVKPYLFDDIDPGRGPRPMDLEFAQTSFSPDGNFVVVSAHGGTLLWDLRQKLTLTLPGELRGLRNHTTLHFAFLPGNRFLITHAWGRKPGFWKAKIVAFPSGTPLSEVRVPLGLIFRATYPGFILVRPFGLRQQGAAVANLSTEEVIVNDGALDVFGDHYIAETVNGKTIALYAFGKRLEASVTIHPD